MTAATTLFGQSELALSAYASLASGISVSLFRKALEDVGFTTSQSDSYVSSWRVIEQYNGEPIPVLDEFNQATGEYAESDALSVTVFEEVATGRRYLAVRGTQSLSDVWTDIVDISILGTSAHQAQYASLKAKVQSWLANGTLSPGFTVTGHSLGGFLAGALLADFRSQIEHAYLYNAPGVGGVAATLTQAVQTLLGHPIDVIDLVKVSNLRADAGISPIAGLGAAWGIPVLIAIENQLAVADAPAALNHSQQVIVDALAVHALLAKMDATVTLEAIGAMLKASSSIAGNTLESVVAVVGKLLDKRYSPVATTREDLYAHLAELHTAIVGRTFTIVSLVNWTSAELKAVALDPDMVATRYALKELNPFVLLGADYSRFKLDLVNESSGEGDLSAQWIEDRATMLAKVIQTNLADGSNIYVDTSLAQQHWSYIDRATGQVIHVDRTTNTPTEDLRRQIVFGTDTDNARTSGADILTGGALADRLYGMSGIDVLQGLGGNDHLEAGKDDDLLLGGTGDDILNGGSGYDSYVWTSTHRACSAPVRACSAPATTATTQSSTPTNSAASSSTASGVKLLVKDGDVWKSPDGKLTLAQTDGRWKLAIAGGGSLDLGETSTTATTVSIASKPPPAASTGAATSNPWIPTRTPTATRSATTAWATSRSPPSNKLAATTASTAARRTTPCAVSPAPTSSSAAAATTPCGPRRLRPPPRPWSMP
jgi:pimeloyl-ACP methyl ester carboxylesterase